jgi:retron-type reverse transcriptase
MEQQFLLSPLLLNYALEYDIRKVQKNQVGLKLNGTHELCVYANDVNLLADNISVIKKNRNFNSR